MDETDSADVIMALAGVIDAFELIRDIGLKGTADAVAKAVSVADIMHKNHDKLTKIEFEN